MAEEQKAPPGTQPVVDNSARVAAEVAVLESMYGPDFQIVQSKTPWATVNAVHEFKVKRYPASPELKDLVSVVLHFKLPRRYPDVPPTFHLEDPVNLTQEHLAGLATRINGVIHKERGQEMLEHICQETGNYIADRHRDLRNPSLQDVQQRRNEQEEKEQEAVLEKARAEQEEAEAREAARVSKIIDDGIKSKSPLTPSPAPNEIDAQDLIVSETGVRSVQMHLGGKGLADDRWSKITIGVQAKCDWLRSVFNAELEVDAQRTEPVSLTTVDLLHAFFAGPAGKRKLKKAFGIFDRLLPLRHSNILPVLSFSALRYSAALPTSSASQFVKRSVSGLTLLILTPPLPPLTLAELVQNAGQLSTSRCLQIFEQLLQGLDYLHSNHVGHHCLTINSLFLQDGTLIIADALWYKHLVHLNKSDPWVREPQSHQNEAWLCPETVANPLDLTRFRTTDIWEGGVVLAQMACGLNVQNEYESPTELLTSGHLDEKIQDLLSLIFVDQRKRPFTSRLLMAMKEKMSDMTVPALQTPTAQTPRSKPSYFTTPAMASQLPEKSIARTKTMDEQMGVFWQPRMSGSGSRYRADFEELEFLGRGGGGQVVKARNRLDGNLYAIKMVKMPADVNKQEKIRREVRFWSRMNHPHIVRYHTSWVETEEIVDVPAIDDSTHASSSRISTQPTASTDNSNEQISSEDFEDSDSDGAPTEFDSDEDDDAARGGHMNLDLGLDDLDFLSVSRSASMSYPSIHFGDEDGKDSSKRPSPTKSASPEARLELNREDTIEPEDAKPKTRLVRTLYIQMEYLERQTLKEAIDEGMKDIDRWRLLSQILSAMIHFNSFNIIHRDLKPSNIFLDDHSNVKIGDFGLAVNQEVKDSSDGSPPNQANDGNDLTTGVGTSLYIAPESLSTDKNDTHVKYSNKIDMYSLGIVFFEMWYPFKTGMERVHVLRDLRKPDIVFPIEWDKDRLSAQTRTIQACLQHDPEKRMSAKDLLAADFLPESVNDESLEATIKLLSKPGTGHARTLINALLNQTLEDRIQKDFTFDFYDGQGAKVDNDPFAEIVRYKLSKIFRQKGAVFMDSPLLMPQSEIYGNRKPVRLIDSEGTIACLPYQLNIPFCRMVARDTGLTRLKRWTIAPVYRRSQGGGQPHAILNAAFDIVSDAATPAAEAECILTLQEIVKSFPFVGEPKHFFNHAGIFDVLLGRVDAKYRPAAIDFLVQHSRLKDRTWPMTSIELLKIPTVTQTTVDELRSLLGSGSLESIQAKVTQMYPDQKRAISDVFGELERVVHLCASLGLPNVLVEPLLATNWDYHRNGVIFETRIVQKNNSHATIAAGGRFDHVVERLAAPEVRRARRCPHVVGFSLAVAQLSEAAATANTLAMKALSHAKTDAQRVYGHWAIRRCDVYVVSFTRGLIDHRLDVAKDLWKAGVRADVMYDDNFVNMSLDQIVNACRKEGISWLVFVKATADTHKKKGYTGEKLKVKNVLRGEEDEVERTELASWLLRSLRDSDSQGAVGTGDLGEVSVTHAADPFSTSKPEFMERLIAIVPERLPTKKDDRNQRAPTQARSFFNAQGEANVSRQMAQASKALIFVIDVQSHVLDRMGSSNDWLTEDKVFSHVKDLEEPSKSEYMNKIRKTILDRLRRANSNQFWITTPRQSPSYLMTLIKKA